MKFSTTRRLSIKHNRRCFLVARLALEESQTSWKKRDPNTIYTCRWVTEQKSKLQKRKKRNKRQVAEHTQYKRKCQKKISIEDKPMKSWGHEEQDWHMDTDRKRRYVTTRTDKLSNWKTQASTWDTGGEKKKSEIKEMKSKHDTWGQN